MRDYNPEIDLQSQQILHDEMDSIRILLNDLPEGHGGVFAFVIFNETGSMHTSFCGAYRNEQERSNAAIGLIDITRSILVEEH